MLITRASLFGRTGFGWQRFEASNYLSRKNLDLGIFTQYSRVLGWSGGIQVRLRIPVGSLHAEGRRISELGQYSHNYLLHGGIELGREFRMLPYGNQLSSASVRVFEDIDGDGMLGNTESILPEVQVQVWQGGITRRRNNHLLVEGLAPYKEYQMAILESTIHDPLLLPSPGYTFSFIADPGHVKRVDIPLVRPRLVTGRITGDTAFGRFYVRHVVDGEEKQRVNVYQDGGFSLLVTEAQSTLVLVDAVTEEELLSVPLMEDDYTVVLDLSQQ